MPARICRTSVPISTSRRRSLSAFLTRSATFTRPTRSSILAKSSMVILGSATVAGVAMRAGVEALGAVASGVIAAGASVVAAAVVAGSAATGVRRSSSIACILSIADLSARGKTGSILPSLVPNGSSPHLIVDKLKSLISPNPSCDQIFAVASGITGYASAVTIRRASAAV